MPGVFSSMCNSLQSTGLTNQTRLLHGPPNFHLGNEGYERHWRGDYASVSWVPSSCRWAFKNLYLGNYLLSPVFSKWRIGFWNLWMAAGWDQNTCAKAQKIPWENKIQFSSGTSKKDCDQQNKQVPLNLSVHSIPKTLVAFWTLFGQIFIYHWNRLKVKKTWDVIKMFTLFVGCWSPLKQFISKHLSCSEMEAIKMLSYHQLLTCKLFFFL